MAKQTQQAFQKSNYNVRFLKCEYGRSKSSGNPMFTIEYELAKNDPVPTKDKKDTVDINGLGGRLYIPFTAKNKAKLNELYSRLGLDQEHILVDNECTESNHPDPKEFEGLLVNASVGCEEVFARSAPKGERINPDTGEKIPAQQEGDLIKHPQTGKPISQGFQTTLMWTEIYYKVEEAVA